MASATQKRSTPPIAAVREQAAHGQRPKLEKVREFINGVSNAWLNSEGKAKKLQALAELDAFEKEG